MKKLLIISFLILSSCTQNSQSPTPPKENNPQNPEEVSEGTYLPSENNLVMVDSESNLNNYIVITTLEGSSGIVNGLIKSLNISGEVKSISASSGISITENCRKLYSAAEICPVQISYTGTTKRLNYVRIYTNQGSRFFIVKIQRTPLNQSHSLSVLGDGNFGTISNNFSKTLTVKNSGNIAATGVEISLAGPDAGAFELISLCPSSINSNFSCTLRVKIKTQEKGNGLYQSQIVVAATSQGNAVLHTLSAEVTGSSIVNHPPVLEDSEVLVEADSSLVKNLSASDAEGDPVKFSLGTNNLGASITETGLLTLNPTLAQVGDQILPIKISDGKSPAVTRNLVIAVLPKLVISGSLFSEGQILDPAFTATFQGSRTMSSLSTNLHYFMSVVKITGSGIGSLTPWLGEDGELPVTNSFPLTFNFSGAMKYSVNTKLNFYVTFQDGKSFIYKRTIQIEPVGLPYVKYDLYVVHPSDESPNSGNTGYSSGALLASLQELKRISAGWRVPIVDKIRIKPLICSGTEVKDFIYSSHRTCLKDNASLDSETAYFFRNTFSSPGSAVGGIALGTRAGFAVDVNNVYDTLAHELGHNLGLFHTFEASGNDYVLHKFSTGNPQQYSLIRNTGSRNLATPGDWLDYRFSYDPGQVVSVVSVNYGAITDDVGIDFWNGKNVVINDQVCFTPQICVNIGPNDYHSGVSAIISVGSQSWTDSAYACTQSFSTKIVSCSNVPDLGNFSLSSSIVNNTMSYWLKSYGVGANSNFSSGQKLRMDKIISLFPELENRP